MLEKPTPLVVILDGELVDLPEERFGSLARVGPERLKPCLHLRDLQCGVDPLLVPQIRPLGLDVLELAQDEFTKVDITRVILDDLLTTASSDVVLIVAIEEVGIDFADQVL